MNESDKTKNHFFVQVLLGVGDDISSHFLNELGKEPTTESQKKMLGEVDDFYKQEIEA